MPDALAGVRRVFVACCLSPAGAGELNAWSARALGALGLRTVPAERLHATLFFAARASAEAVESMSATVESVIWTPVGCRPGTLRLFGRNAVGLTLEWADSAGVRLLRAVASALAQEGPSLADPLSDSLQSLGAQFAPFGDLGRKWHPHITVARATQSADLRRLRLPRPPPLALTFDRLALFESRLAPTGPEYRVLARSVDHSGSRPAL